MEQSLTFIAQGKFKDYSGKSTIMNELGKGKEVELTFYNDDNKIVIINHLGEVSGCIPPNPRLIAEFPPIRIWLEKHFTTPNLPTVYR